MPNPRPFTEAIIQPIGKALFGLLALICLIPILPVPSEVASWVAPVALIAGICLGLTVGNPYPGQSKVTSRLLLQGAVVLLGFSMDFAKVVSAGREGLLFGFCSIVAVFALGWILQRALKIRPVTALLVSAGTAICGGSAIAAISSVVDAPDEDVSVAVATVFLLNAVALLAFPAIGHALQLTQHQFGVWSGIAIHDVASVVGAGAAYGPDALETATAVKLSRVLYLVPITLIAATIYQRSNRSSGKIQIPWFIGLFLVASAVRSNLPDAAAFAPEIKKVATIGFALALYLIGSGISRKTLKSVGVRPLILGTSLWLFISVAALILVRV